jgi:hypothetical protein
MARMRGTRHRSAHTAINAELLLVRHIRARVNQIADDLGTFERRVSSLGSQIAGLHGDNAILHQRMDRIDARLDHIEHRLDLHKTA